MSELDDLYAEAIAPPKKRVEPVIPSKYDSPVRAGLAGVARAATFGLSDPLMRYGLNIHPETLEGLKEANPASSIVGEIGGIGLSLASGVGAPSAIAKFGNLARGAVAAKNANLLARLGGHAVAGMAEGGLYGLSQYISDTGLDENPNLSAEKLMASVAGGALTGGALGGAGGAVGEGLSAAKNMVASQLSGLTLREGLKKLAAKGMVRSVAQMGDYAKGALEDADEIGAFALKNARLPERADAYRMAEKFGALKEEIGNERIGKVLAQADDAARNTVGPLDDTVVRSEAATLPGGKLQVEGFDFLGPVSRAKKELLEPLRRDPANDALVNSFDDLLNGYLKRQLEKPFSFKEAFKIQSDLWRNTPDGPLKGRADVLNQWRDMLRSEIMDQAEAVVPEAGKALKAAARDYRSAAELERLAGKASARLEGKSPLNPAYFVQRFGGNLSAHVINELADSAAVKAMSRGLKNNIDNLLSVNPAWGGMFRGELELASARGAMNLLETHVKLAENDPNYLAAVGHVDEPPALLKDLAARSAQLEGAAQILAAQDQARDKAVDGFLKGKSLTGDKKSLSLKGYNELSKLYQDAVSNPDILTDLASPKELINVAPDLAPQISASAARAAHYLHATMPKPPEPQLMDSLDRGWVPDQLSLARWSRCIKAVQDPNSVIAGLADGSATKEGIHALRTVYPELFQDAQQAIMERLATHKKILNQQQRSVLSMFLDQAVGGQGDPSMLILSQNLYNTHKMQKPQMSGPDGRQKVSQEENAQTQAQRIEGR